MLCRRFSATAGLLALFLAVEPARAQPPLPGRTSRYELSGTVQLDRADDHVLKALERVRTHLADKQWAEAVDTLCQVMEQSGTKLFPVTERRLIGVRDYCHLQLASLPPEALRLYRDRVDPQVKRRFEEAAARRDARGLLGLLDQAFASSWGDNALEALGEIALESGDYAAARAYWERIVPFDQPPDMPRTWLGVPDTELDLASIRARLVLVSILEGSSGRAKEDLARFTKLHPDARGRFGGREVNYAAALSSLLAESAQWPRAQPSGDWPTFAGSPSRNKIAPKPPDVQGAAWRLPLQAASRSERPVLGAAPIARRAADGAGSPLSYHPVVVRGLVLVNVQAAILAVDLRTGRPAWSHKRPVIHEDPNDEALREAYNPPDSLGVPRFTMTVWGDKLLARMGPSWTSRPRESLLPGGSGYLVCLDLAAEGRLVWKIAPDEGLAFEGSPLSDGTSVYVAVRRSDIQPQLHVVCYDAQTGQRRWQQFVCAADTPARGALGETTHNLLTLHRETLYCNTNLGAVAALSARDGRVLWVTLYPRVLEGDLQKPAPFSQRDLTPCLLDRGTLVVAPADCREVFALDAATGQALWHTGDAAEDIVHLLGVAGDSLIASGGKLYWIGLKEPGQGRVKHVWPEGPEKLGYGRGVLAGDCVLWPTREKIYVFDQSTGRMKREIALAPRGVTGGNLLVTDGHLLIATGTELIALDQGVIPRESPKTKENPKTFQTGFHALGRLEGTSECKLKNAD